MRTSGTIKGLIELSLFLKLNGALGTEYFCGNIDGWTQGCDTLVYDLSPESRVRVQLDNLCARPARGNIRKDFLTNSACVDRACRQIDALCSCGAGVVLSWNWRLALAKVLLDVDGQCISAYESAFSKAYQVPLLMARSQQGSAL